MFYSFERYRETGYIQDPHPISTYCGTTQDNRENNNQNEINNISLKQLKHYDKQSLHKEVCKRIQKQVKRNTMNRKIIKMFAAITMLFLLSFVPTLLFLFKVVTKFHVMYAYFLNHCGNPFVYYILDKSFRDKVKHVFSKLT